MNENNSYIIHKIFKVVGLSKYISKCHLWCSSLNAESTLLSSTNDFTVATAATTEHRAREDEEECVWLTHVLMWPEISADRNRAGARRAYYMKCTSAREPVIVRRGRGVTSQLDSLEGGMLSSTGD